MSFKFKLSVNVSCVYKIDNAFNFTGMILERIQVFIFLAVENDCSAIEVVAGLTNKSLYMSTVHGKSKCCSLGSVRISGKGYFHICIANQLTGFYMLGNIGR